MTMATPVETKKLTSAPSILPLYGYYGGSWKVLG